MFSTIKFFQKFFFFSELLWITLFLLILCLEIMSESILLFNNCFFILVFTALEGLILGCILLLKSKL